MIQEITAKSLLSQYKDPDPIFGISYSINVYRGCQFQCIYCDSRSKCYQIENFSNIVVKTNAPELIKKELSKKKKKGTIGTGSMNDPYMPVEKSLKLVRKVIEIINRYHFPLHVLTKSDLVLRDADIFQELSKTYCAISFTITTSDNTLAKRIEPHAPIPSSRFDALYQLRKQNIYCGIALMPILPFINDSVANIKDIVEKAADAGVKYILPYFGLTLREGSREYFYEKLDLHFPEIKEKYKTTFGLQYECPPSNIKKLYEAFYEGCEKHQIETKIAKYREANDQLSLF